VLYLSNINNLYYKLYIPIYTFTLIQKSVTEYGCGSGQCVNISNTCNGIRDYNDGSDEILLLCETVM